MTVAQVVSNPVFNHNLGSSATLVDLTKQNSSSAVPLDVANCKRDVKEYSLPHEPAHKEIFQALKKRIEAISEDSCDPGDDNSFFVCDLGEIVKLYNNWFKELPRVQPYYAVKCNPNSRVLSLLSQLGCNFDCASKSEIDQVLDMGVDPSRIIYANPCKASSFIRYASKTKVLKSTFDNVEELYKIKKYHPDSELLIRISTDDSTAQCRLSTKYGCELSEVQLLLTKVKELGLTLVGVSFHVGSGASDFTSLYKAIRDSRHVFNEVEKVGLPPLKILDIGGGFQFESFKESSAVVRHALDEFFPAGENEELNIIAEPGRYFVSTAFTLATHVIAKRTLNDHESMIYINDGVYGNMNCILFDHQEPTPRVLYHSNEYHYYDFESTSSSSTNYDQKVSIWGPTCDGLDCITQEYYIKHNLVVGDWLYFPNLGAYTSTAATPFNGFQQVADTIYINGT